MADVLLRLVSGFKMCPGGGGGKGQGAGLGEKAQAAPLRSGPPGDRLRDDH